MTCVKWKKVAVHAARSVNSLLFNQSYIASLSSYNTFMLCINSKMNSYRLFVCLFVWCLTARQHRIGQFVPTAGRWNRLSWLRMANETQCIILNTLHNVTQFTIKHSSYKNATTGYRIELIRLVSSNVVPSGEKFELCNFENRYALRPSSSNSILTRLMGEFVQVRTRRTQLCLNVLFNFERSSNLALAFELS